MLARRGRALWPRALHASLGLLLLVAAGLKAEELASDSWLGHGPTAHRVFLALLIQAELLLGVWVLSGLARKAASRLLLIVFAIFALISLSEALAGQSSCGCFGRLTINPWYTTVLDLAAVVSLAISPLGDDQTDLGCRRLRRALVYAVGVVGASMLTVALAQNKPGEISADGIARAHGPVLLDPKTWVGKRLPILPYIEIADDLSVGSWLIVLVHDDCPKCRAVLPRYEQLARQWRAQASSSRVAVIELPPFHFKDDSIGGAASDPCSRGRLRGQIDWIAETPAAIRVLNGLVAEPDTAVQP